MCSSRNDTRGDDLTHDAERTCSREKPPWQVRIVWKNCGITVARKPSRFNKWRTRPRLNFAKPIFTSRRHGYSWPWKSIRQLKRAQPGLINEMVTLDRLAT